MPLPAVTVPPAQIPAEVPVEAAVEEPAEELVVLQADVPVAMTVEAEPQTPATPVFPLPTTIPTSESRVPIEAVKVFEDPFTEEQPKPKPTFTLPVLEDKPVNENAAGLQSPHKILPASEVSDSPEKTKQNARLLESGIAKIKAKSLEVHGFRKLQALIRDSKTVFTDESFETLLIGLFQYLEDPLSSVPNDKAQDVKAQILATIKLLLRRERANFHPHVSRGLESLLETRSGYEGRAHIVSGLELLADELVTIGDSSEIVAVLVTRLQECSDADRAGCRSLTMGLHVLKELLDKRAEFEPSEAELSRLAGLASKRLDSADSGVRMDAVQLCVALHSRVGENKFWEALHDVKDDPKSLITYYIVKRQREQQN
jgi:CLIP-associating protein 1/2